MTGESTGQEKRREEERSSAREALRAMGIAYAPESLRSYDGTEECRRSGHSGPDVKVECSIDGGSRHVGIEVEGYTQDAFETTSRGKKIGSAHQRISQHSAEVQRLVGGILAGRSDLGKHSCHVRYDPAGGGFPSPLDVAEEIVRLIEEHPDELEATRADKARGLDFTRDNGLAGYTVLNRCFLLINLSQDQLGLWYCENVDRQKRDPGTICQIINKKAGKQRNYDRSDTSETWLMIVAGKNTAHASLGPTEDYRRWAWDESIKTAASKSGFDRVLIFDLAKSAWVWPYNRPSGVVDKP